MLVVNKNIDTMLSYNLKENYELNEIIFFDIETTGFSPEHTILYLIGCVYYSDNQWNIIQWFADNNLSEKKMLIGFFEFIKDYRVLIHYNGTGFDMPYILKKCKKYDLDYNFSNIDSIDIYKRIFPYKKVFKTDNLKQKSVEKFLNIHRDDKYSGGELIEVYGNYIKNKSLNENQAEKLYQLLILHNEDDLKGMLMSVQILYYCDLFEQDLIILDTLLEDDYLMIQFQLSHCLPQKISLSNDILYFSAFHDNATLKISLYKNEVKFFYDNYKDYYYLPIEDTAIHKSIAFYVDREFRIKAKASNCYSKKTGCFLPQYYELINPCFKIDYYDKTKYFEVTQEVVHDKKLMKQYAVQLLSKLLRS